jgi:hypothetical protein
MEKLISLLRLMFILAYSVLFFPFIDQLASIFNCSDDNHHYMLRDLVCYSSEHIQLMVAASIGLVLFLSINLMIATLYNETQPVKEDALSRLDSNFELIMLVYRTSMSALTVFCAGPYCSWVIIVISLLSSVYFLFQYFKFLPYYNSTVSLLFGAMLGVYFWISLNGLLMGLYTMSGHITVILIGIPLVVGVMKSLREKRIEWLMSTTID